ncbi:hypothetical protein HETIRDRAFT_124417 [Heterobasidion irregulare TC 32-1]|uniref:EXPERA domain-containing protein n=1 Tax=Heterobasidion irregulare (strain TC 32-1) TaxID=747525 RepID=W4K1J3_HETIT|nr:uncharacterized protein HETIRDRAFT_124417 [Heterobasidion irregulare TC 32-1]ETW79693.1 hypothetical protein HETIRDRAFT_124417 [Heterobasidion irregulare TC 32-1]
MALKTYSWITFWFLASAPVIFWDAGYCFFRPRSMKGGDLHWIWKPYEIYQEIDYVRVYGVKALAENNGFTNAQSALNIVETLLNLLYAYLAHISHSPIAPAVGFASVTMTLSKTVLYWLNEYFCGWCSIGHNAPRDLLVYWIIPNGIWLVVPSCVLYTLGRDIARALRAHARPAARESKKAR